MTSDEFNSQYKLLSQMTVKEGRSYTAEHRASGRAVLVHVLDEAQLGGLSSLQAMLERLEPRDRSRVLATMTVDQSLIVVTQFLQGFEGFEPWLRSRVAGPPEPVVPPTGPPEVQHGEFTRLFRAENTPAPSPGPPPSKISLPHDAAPPAGANFTDLFRASARPPAGPSGSDSATIPPVRIVGVRLPASSEPASPEPGPPRLSPNFETSGESPGQAPRLNPNFETSGESPGPPPRLSPNFEASRESPGPAPRLNPNFETSGESPAPGNLAGWPRADEVIIRGSDQPAVPVPPSSWDGPSEYTRLFGSVSPPTGELAQAAEIPESHDQPPEPKRSYIPLFVVLNLVFILATGIVVYFALRRC